MQRFIQSSTSPQGVMTLCMNRPEVHNAFDPEMIATLTAALQAAQQDKSVRVIVITGAGASFSAGADLNWMRSLVDASEEDNERDALALARLMRTLNFLPKPTVARINGAAFGGGVGLVASCDITIAVDNAYFGLTEARLGLAPAVVSPYVLRRIGEHHARRYFMSGERFDTRQAQRIGLVQQCVSAAELDPAVAAVVDSVLKGGPFAVSCGKQLSFAMAGHSAQQQESIDKYTARLIAGLRVSAEGQEGLSAFLEKRQPAWLDD